MQNQERLKPEATREEKNEEDRSKVDDLRGSPMAVGTMEEIIDDDHAIISTASGPEFYVSIMSYVDKDLLEPNCQVLLHHKTQSIVGVLQDDADPLVSIMKLDKAPTESYADIGGLESQIQEIKVCGIDVSFFALLILCRNLWSCPLHIPNCTKKWVSNHPRASYCMVSRGRERHFWLKLLLTKHQQLSCVSLVLSLFRSILEMVLSLFASCSEWQKSMRRVLFSLMKSTQLVQNGSSSESLLQLRLNLFKVRLNVRRGT